MSSYRREDDVADDDVMTRLAALREEIEAIAATVSAATPPAAPVRLHGTGRDALRYWHDGRHVRVHTQHSVDGTGSVYLSDAEHSWDWTALTPDEARALGSALLAAAGDTVPHLRAATA